MAAPKLKYVSGNSSSTTLSSSVTESATGFPLANDTNFSAKSGEGMVKVDEGQQNEEFAYATGKSGASLTVPLANRGLEGGSAQGHFSGASVRGILTSGMWNDLIDTMRNFFDQDTGALDTTKVPEVSGGEATTLTVTGATNVTLPTTGTLSTLAGTQTLTNKTINADNNTLQDIGSSSIKDSAITTAKVADANITNRKMKLDEIQHVTSTTDMNTASTSYIDYTGLSVTFTPNVASNFLVLFSCVYYLSATAVSTQSFIVDLDGSTSGNDPFCSGSWSNASTGNTNIGASGWMWITGVTAASHTLKIRLKTSGGTVRTRYGQLTVIPFAS